MNKKMCVYCIHRYLPCRRTLMFHLIPAFLSTVIHCNFYVDCLHECTTWRSHYGRAQQVHWITDKMSRNGLVHDDKITLKFGYSSPATHWHRQELEIWTRLLPSLYRSRSLYYLDEKRFKQKFWSSELYCPLLFNYLLILDAKKKTIHDCGFLVIKGKRLSHLSYWPYHGMY